MRSRYAELEGNWLTCILSTISVMIIGSYACYQLYAKLVLDPLENAASEAIKNLSEEEVREMENEEQKPFFIPFPGTTKQLPPKPYKGSDPEWQEFVKFSKDKDLAKQVRGTNLFSIINYSSLDIRCRSPCTVCPKSSHAILCIDITTR